jgi:hypothetical protein
MTEGLQDPVLIQSQRPQELPENMEVGAYGDTAKLPLATLNPPARNGLGVAQQRDLPKDLQKLWEHER